MSTERADVVDIDALARALDEATLAGRPIRRLTETTPLDVATGYRVQRAVIERRRARGENLIGVKMGFTSRAKMSQMGIDDVIWGLLTDAMPVADGETLDTSGLIHPRVEPEVAFLLGRAVRSPADVGAAVAGVAVGYEILDSRYRDFRFSLPDVVADNASAAAFGFGPWRDPAVDLSNVGLLLEVDGRTVATGSSAAILGDPLRSLAAAARLAGAAGITLEPGQVVLAGAATEAVPLPRGAHVRVSTARLGRVEVTTR